MIKSYQAPNKSWMDTWIPAIFGSAPGRLLEIPLKPKSLEQVYGLNIDSITEYTPINHDAGHDKSARSKTTNNDCTHPRAVRFSWHSQTSESMMKLKVPRDSIPWLFAWKPPGEVAATKDQNRIGVDKVSDHDTNDTLLLTQIWKVQNTLQFTRKTDTYSPKRKKHGYKSTLSSRRLNELTSWSKAVEGRQRVRRKGRSKAGTKTIEKYVKAMGTPPKSSSQAACRPRNSTVRSQPQKPVKQSQCSTEENSGNTV
ncbi:hypothetical protein NEUTE2DRAFT_49991 [Neurospora tetrasperma FGSC 2509]|nr:hypothetical protein NEUTE2DRAFT_49991 [Neurospora tetrasperma FGSC 2509]